VVFWSCRDHLRLRYRTEEGLQDYVVPIIWRPMTHRGSQPFFRCPGNGGIWAPEPDLDLQAEYLADSPRELAPGCGKPQVKLYLSPDGERLACRDCDRVSYASSQDVRPRPWWNGCLVRAAQSGPARVTKGFLLSLMQAGVDPLGRLQPEPTGEPDNRRPLGGTERLSGRALSAALLLVPLFPLFIVLPFPDSKGGPS
jgi:hypothetical protein